MKEVALALIDKLPPIMVALLAIVFGLLYLLNAKEKANAGLAREVERLSTLLETLVFHRRVIRRSQDVVD